jgi:hypothetical protein
LDTKSVGGSFFENQELRSRRGRSFFGLVGWRGVGRVAASRGQANGRRRSGRDEMDPSKTFA